MIFCLAGRSNAKTKGYAKKWAKRKNKQIFDKQTEIQKIEENFLKKKKSILRYHIRVQLSTGYDKVLFLRMDENDSDGPTVSL